ncbi:MAG: hypothetical protein ABIA93_01385 [Candidatus Woesearchaeota archaeon]
MRKRVIFMAGGVLLLLVVIGVFAQQQNQSKNEIQAYAIAVNDVGLAHILLSRMNEKTESGNVDQLELNETLNNSNALMNQAKSIFKNLRDNTKNEKLKEDLDLRLQQLDEYEGLHDDLEQTGQLIGKASAVAQTEGPEGIAIYQEEIEATLERQNNRFSRIESIQQRIRALWQGLTD